MDITNLILVTILTGTNAATYTATDDGFSSSAGGFYFASEVEAFVADALNAGRAVRAVYRD